MLNTVGSPADLRYFAPRILQLVLTGELAWPDVPLVCRKLAQAGWQDWPEAPYLRRLLDALWPDVLHDARKCGDTEAVLSGLGAADPDGTGGRVGPVRSVLSDQPAAVGARLGVRPDRPRTGCTWAIRACGQAGCPASRARQDRPERA
ncbi:hypothetical protein ACFC1T_05120 [Kitasatospora sp. NPDC056076]|uniref:hypothetical protein n=1 Tax=Kitasatospora sp. NPDC056076 TaxID=3345703 RepID=UPI0035DFB31C